MGVTLAVIELIVVIIHTICSSLQIALNACTPVTDASLFASMLQVLDTKVSRDVKPCGEQSPGVNRSSRDDFRYQQQQPTSAADR